MSSDVSIRELLSRANDLLASGDTVSARSIAQQAYKLNKNDPDVLVLVSKVITDPARQRIILQQALQIAPMHREARERLAALDAPLIPVVPPAPIVSPAPQRSFPVVPVLGGLLLVVAVIAVFVGIVINRPQPTAAPTEPSTAVAAQPTLPIMLSVVSPPPASTTPIRATLTLIPTLTPSAIISASPTALPNPSTSPANAGLDPIVLTATALTQSIAATGTNVAQGVADLTQSANLTQTATQQGALGATVVIQQTALALANTLPGTMIAFRVNTDSPASPKVRVIDGKPNKLVPDGHHIVFQQTDGIYLAAVDGSTAHRVMLPDATGDNTDWTWAPDGQALLMVIGRQPAQQMYVVSLADGTMPKLLTPPPEASIYKAYWSPDNHWLAWDVAGQLYLVNAESGVFHKVMSGNLTILDMRWSPDSLHVAFAAMTSTGSTFSVYVADITHPDQTAHVVSARPFANPQSFNVGSQISHPIAGWTADSQQLIFAGNGSDIFKHLSGGIYSVRFDGQSQHLLRDITAEKLLINDVELSPNAQFIVLSVLTSFPDVSAAKRQLYRLALDGTDFKQLDEGSLANTYRFNWSPDGHFIVVIRDDYGSGTPLKRFWLSIADAVVHSLPEADYPGPWSPDSLSFAVCRTQNHADRTTTSQTWIVPINGQLPSLLFDHGQCPMYWVS